MKSFLIVLPVVFLMILLGIDSTTQAQNRTITGTVTNAKSGESLLGVNVTVKNNPTTGTSTNANGKYSLQVPTKAKTLIFSFVGFQKREVTIGNRKVINVAMKEASRQLNKLVVVGYGQTSKQNLTGSVSSINGSEIENETVNNNVEKALQGHMAGVQVTSQSGKLGQAVNVHIRGTTSISASSQPLYVVDGVPVISNSISSEFGKTSPLASLDMSNIKSITVLKGASAAAIYGSRGSNGVVIIKTKNGKSGKTKYDVSYKINSRSPTHKLDLMDAKQYVAFNRRAAIGGAKYDYRMNPGQWSSKQQAIDSYLKNYRAEMNFLASGNDWQNNPVNYNWQDRAFQKGLSHNLQLSASGGNKNTTFFASGGYSNQEGILLENAYRKFSGQLNLQNNPSNWIKLGLRVNINRSLNNREVGDASFDTPIQMIAQPPIEPFFNDAEPDKSGYQKGTKNNLNTLYPNNYDIITNEEHKTRMFHTLANANVRFNIITNLTFKSQFGMDLLTQNEENYSPPHLSYYTGAHGTGYNAWTQVQNYNIANTLNYKNTFASKNNLKVLVGTSYNWVMHTFNSTSGQNFPSKEFTNINNAASITAGNVTDSDYRFLSYFVRANYNYNHRYLFKISARADGSSRFGRNNRYGFFPAGSVGWLLSNEGFMSNVEFLSSLKLRASYGVTGNANIGNFPSRGLYSGFAYAGTPALSQTQIANPNLTWETTKELDIGVDYGFLHNRINGEIDYYNKKTKNLLLEVNVPGTSGFSTQLRNVGKLKNRGLELSVNSQNIKGAFSWTSSFNISFNRNKITDLGGQVLEVQSYANRYVNRAIKGQPLGIYYTKEYAGVNPKNGDALYYINHKPTELELGNDIAFKVNDMFDNRFVTNDPNHASRKVVGDPNPDFTGGFDNTFSYKRISLDVFLHFVYGDDIYNTNYFTWGTGEFYDPEVVSQLKAWQKPGDITDVPQARHGFNNGVSIRSSRYVYDGSYLRLKNVRLSYSIPERLLSKVNFTKVSLFVQGTNLLTVTSYPGYDPEVNNDYVQSNLNINNAFYTAPQARVITGGLNIKF